MHQNKLALQFQQLINVPVVLCRSA